MAGYGGFGPSKFEQAVDGGVSNVGTALFGNPLQAGRMAYMRARAGLEDQQSQDAAQAAASRDAMAAIFANSHGQPLSPDDVARVYANGFGANNIDGVSKAFLGMYANAGAPDSVVARAHVGNNGVIGPTDAFSIPGQAAIIQGQNQQADDIQRATAGAAFAQALMGQQHEDSRNAANNAQSGANNSATIAGEDARLHTSPEQLAQTRILAGKGTPDDYKLMGILHPGNATSDQPIKVTPAEADIIAGQIQDAMPAGATFDPSLKQSVVARAIQLYQDKTSPAFGNSVLAAKQATSELLDTTPTPGKLWGTNPHIGPKTAPAAAAPATTVQPQGRLIGDAPAGVPDGKYQYTNGVPSGVVRGGKVYSIAQPGGA